MDVSAATKQNIKVVKQNEKKVLVLEFQKGNDEMTKIKKRLDQKQLDSKHFETISGSCSNLPHRSCSVKGKIALLC